MNHRFTPTGIIVLEHIRFFAAFGSAFSGSKMQIVEHFKNRFFLNVRNVLNSKFVSESREFVDLYKRCPMSI